MASIFSLKLKAKLGADRQWGDVTGREFEESGIGGGDRAHIDYGLTQTAQQAL